VSGPRPPRDRSHHQGQFGEGFGEAGSRRYVGPEVVEASAEGWGEERFEQWAMTVANAGPFIPQSGPPVFISDAFVVAARAAGVLPQVLPLGDLPAAGETVQTAKLDSGASAAPQATEGNADSTTDPVSSTVSGPVALAAGHVDLSIQALQRSDPHLGDVALASELGKALAEQVDVAILNGSGSAGQTRGLLNVSGVTANTVATATQLVVLPAVYKLLSDTSTAAGSPADMLLVHPRRHRWFMNDHDAAGLYGPPYTSIMSDVKVVQTPSMVATAGAGTNEDRIIALCRDRAVSVFMSPVRFAIMLDVLSGSLQARAQASCYLAVLPREPKAIGILSGAGLVSPTFS